MVNFMNAFYALDDIKKRTKRFYNKIDGVEEAVGKEGPDDSKEMVKTDNNKFDSKDLLDDNYIFRHFYQNKIFLIK